MLFAFVLSCLRVLLDLADVRCRAQDPMAEVLLLRHELRVLRRQIHRLNLKPSDRATIAAFAGLVPRRSLGGLVRPETVLGWHHAG